jgi:hypothetical protein
MSTRSRLLLTVAVAAAVVVGVRARGGPGDDDFFAPYDEKALTEARGASRPVLIKTYADW